MEQVCVTETLGFQSVRVDPRSAGGGHEELKHASQKRIVNLGGPEERDSPRNSVGQLREACGHASLGIGHWPFVHNRLNQTTEPAPKLSERLVSLVSECLRP